MDNPNPSNTKIVIGKTWFYVGVLLVAVMIIFLYRDYNDPKNITRNLLKKNQFNAKDYKEPENSGNLL